MFEVSRTALVLLVALPVFLLLVIAAALWFHTRRLRSELEQRQRISNELRASEERWEIACEGSNEVIWDWNGGSDDLYISARLMSMLGYETSTPVVSFKHWVKLIHPDDVDRISHQFLLHLRRETDFFQTELRLRCYDHSYRCFQIRGRARHDHTGKVTRMAGSATDITEQQFIRAQVKDRTEQLDATFSLSTDAFVTFDQQLRVKYVNPAFQQLTGMAPETVLGLTDEALGEKINALCVSNRPFPGMQALRALAASPGKIGGELIELVFPTRCILHVSLNTNSAVTVSQILYLRDVTHAVIVEDMKSEFLSTAAHELRTPMANILGFAELLATRDFEEKERKEFQNIILAQSQRMATILDELLDLARIEARKGKDFVFTRVNLKELVQEITDSFNLPEGRSAPLITLPDLYCKADQGKARQTILNVLSNAYKYSPANSAVQIFQAEPAVTNNRALVGIVIQDHGIGIEKQHLPRVFERFYRVDTSGSTPGTGLGMSIVKELMGNLGGEVLIDSTPGKGTAVTLLFPLYGNEKIRHALPA